MKPILAQWMVLLADRSENPALRALALLSRKLKSRDEVATLKAEIEATVKQRQQISGHHDKCYRDLCESLAQKLRKMREQLAKQSAESARIELITDTNDLLCECGTTLRPSAKFCDQCGRPASGKGGR